MSGEAIISRHIGRFMNDRSRSLRCLRSVWLANEPWVRIVVAFTDNVEAHCAALRAVVAHPGRLEVVRRDHAVQDRRRVRAEIEP